MLFGPRTGKNRRAWSSLQCALVWWTLESRRCRVAEPTEVRPVPASSGTCLQCPRSQARQESQKLHWLLQETSRLEGQSGDPCSISADLLGPSGDGTQPG
uniref:Putative secreted protein n=1 Tax=Ixodes ricinus TaxID=34613 RepID=A0A6B0U8F1_IXORI